MFTDDVLEKIFSHPEMRTIPVGAQSTAVHAFQEVMDDIRKENPYGTISELFSDGAATDV